MAKKAAKKRTAAGTRSASKPAYVKTGRVLNAMQKVLDDLNEKRRGETGWTEREDFKVKEAVVLLKVAIKKLDCTPSQSYPRP